MTTQKLIKKYKTKLSKVDESLAQITKRIRKGLEGDITVDMDDLRQKEVIGYSRRKFYTQVIKDLESIQ